MKGREIGMFVGWEFLCRGNKCIHLLTKSKEALRLPLQGRPILLNQSYHDYRLDSDPLSSVKCYEIANEKRPHHNGLPVVSDSSKLLDSADFKSPSLNPRPPEVNCNGLGSSVKQKIYFHV